MCFLVVLNSFLLTINKKITTLLYKYLPRKFDQNEKY